MLRARSYPRPARPNAPAATARTARGRENSSRGAVESAQPVRLHSAPPAPKASISCGRMTTFDGSSVAFCVRSLFRCLPRIGRSLCRARSRLSEDLADRPRAARPHPRRVATDRGAVSRLTNASPPPHATAMPPAPGERAARPRGALAQDQKPAAPAVKREAEEDWALSDGHAGGKQPIVRLRISNNPAMGEAKEKRRAHAVILTAHPWCIYCGMKANTIEHMPPRAMFDKRQRPKGLEFPTCRDCNNGTSLSDMAASLLARAYPDARTPDDLKRLLGGARNNIPGLIEEMVACRRRPIASRRSDSKEAHQRLRSEARPRVAL